MASGPGGEPGLLQFVSAPAQPGELSGPGGPGVRAASQFALPAEPAAGGNISYPGGDPVSRHRAIEKCKNACAPVQKNYPRLPFGPGDSQRATRQQPGLDLRVSRSGPKS